jgi:DNA-binding NtrC family response regulator
MMRRVLLVEDEEILRISLGNELRRRGYDVHAVADGNEGLSAIEEEEAFDIALLDVRLPQRDGLELLRALRERNPETVAIMMTAYGTVEEAVTAMKLGAHDYLVKPFPTEALLLTLSRAGEYLDLRRENVALRDRLDRLHRFGSIVCASKRMKEVCDLARMAAESDITVLIQGETGTGKELMAGAIHHNSARRHGPFIKVNCAALAESLLETELFGHERGAFTGAVRQKPGRFELADGGTLFLDEVDDLPMPVQVRLLRVLQEKEFERVGGTRPIKVNVRILCASKTALEQCVAEGRIREDLYFRLKVATIVIPPLRERREDIPPLAEHFLKRYAADAGKTVRGFDPSAMRVLLEHPWPGNVRELENAVQRAVAFSKGEALAAEELPGDLVNPSWVKPDGPAPAIGPLHEVMREAERRHITQALERTGWRRAKAAEVLGITRETLWRKIQTLQIAIPGDVAEE